MTDRFIGWMISFTVSVICWTIIFFCVSCDSEAQVAGVNIGTWQRGANLIHADMASAYQRGARHFRLQLDLPDPYFLENSPYSSYVQGWLLGTLDQVDLAIAGIPRDIGVVLSLQHPWCGKNKIWTNNNCLLGFYDTWGQIAHRYKNIPQVFGFDLMNEPNIPEMNHYIGVLANAVGVIRSHTRDKIVIVQSKFGIPSEITRLPLRHDFAPVWYSVHAYDPQRVTHAGITHANFNWSPSRSEVENQFREVLRFRSRAPRIPVYVGEFGCSNLSGITRDNQQAWLNLTIKFLQRNNLDSAFHAWSPGVWDVRGRPSEILLNKYIQGVDL